MYQLFCDSNCELWHTAVQELNLNVIRMPYILEEKEQAYDMGENTDFQEFFNKMRQGSIPKTAALNEYAYTEYFEPVLARGEDIYYITFSHQMSGTFNAMKNVIAQLKEKYPDREIRFRDSKSISMGTGFIVYYAALQYQKGASIDELDKYVEKLIKQVDVYFVVDDLTYLHRGGRINGFNRVLGNLLGIKPVLHIDEEGKIINVGKEKGMKKALSTLRGYIRAEGSDLKNYKMYILHGDCQEMADTFAQSIREEFGYLDIIVQPVGPVIGSHCGPGTVGLIFHKA